jgi:hypothetical protein
LPITIRKNRIDSTVNCSTCKKDSRMIDANSKITEV